MRNDLGLALLAHGEAVRLVPEHEDYRRGLDMAIVVRRKERTSDTAGGSK
ncbi:MAG: hypothetical protein ACREJJ_05575 [Candidatus Methylomirabilales bacterium]